MRTVRAEPISMQKPLLKEQNKMNTIYENYILNRVKALSDWDRESWADLDAETAEEK